ncbi:hypothetical protein ABH309_11795 [Chromobacterium piscinae]|uniref:Uncharacterized protein n=1 Tax=Chromobacterium piscinae TaxID=686831 RepID=A0ABV0H4X3_9NEIS
MKPILFFYMLLLFPVLASAKPITSFDSPPVIDLSDRLRAQKHGARNIQVQQLDATSSTRILRSADGKLVLSPPSESVAELSPAAPNALRSGKMLTVNTLAGSLQFKNWRVSKGEGDFSTFAYRGQVAGGALQRVDLYMGHDAPGSMLVDNRNGKVYFVHSGDHPVAISPDGSAVLEMQPLGWRLQLVALTAEKRNAELFCNAPDNSSIGTDFHGWNSASANGFDLALDAGGQKVAVRFTRAAGGWRMESSHPALLAKLGVHCSMRS